MNAPQSHIESLSVQRAQSSLSSKSAPRSWDAPGGKHACHPLPSSPSDVFLVAECVQLVTIRERERVCKTYWYLLDTCKTGTFEGLSSPLSAMESPVAICSHLIQKDPSPQDQSAFSC